MLELLLMKKGHIEINPKVMVGKPVIAGTRIPVHLVLDLLADGVTPEEIIKDYYSQITKQDIQAALRYGAKAVEQEEIVFVQKREKPREALLR